MSTEQFKQLGYFADVVGVTVTTLSNYVRQIKIDDAEFYKKNTLKKPRPKGGGKPLVFYHVSKWQKLFESMKAKKKINQGRARKPKRAKKKDTHKLKAETIKGYAKEGDDIEVNSDDQIRSNRGGMSLIRNLDFDDYKMCKRLLKEASEFYLTGRFSPKGAAEEVGITIETFWKIINLNEEFEDYWNRVRSEWCNRFKTTMEHYVYRRCLEVISKTKKIKRTTKYVFKPEIDSALNVLETAVPIERTEVEEEFIPKATDLLFAQKAMLELEKKQIEYMPVDIEEDFSGLTIEDRLDKVKELMAQYHQMEQEEEYIVSEDQNNDDNGE